jgi:putative transposase
LQEADARVSVKELRGKRGLSDASFYGWQSKFRGMKVEEAKRLKALEHENARLKRLVAGSMRDIEPLQACMAGFAHERRRFGYRRIRIVLSREGVQANHKRIGRLRRVTGLTARKRRRRVRIAAGR